MRFSEVRQEIKSKIWKNLGKRNIVNDWIDTYVNCNRSDKVLHTIIVNNYEKISNIFTFTKNNLKFKNKSYITTEISELMKRKNYV